LSILTDNEKNKLINGAKIMKTVTYQIPSIHCHHCVHTINMEISELEGVKSVEADLDTKSATITFDAPTTEDKIVETLKSIEYPPVLA
jgi:copper chaperone